jgi:hypothetical protein
LFFRLFSLSFFLSFFLSLFLSLSLSLSLSFSLSLSLSFSLSLFLPRRHRHGVTEWVRGHDGTICSPFYAQSFIFDLNNIRTGTILMFNQFQLFLLPRILSRSRFSSSSSTAPSSISSSFSSSSSSSISSSTSSHCVFILKHSWLP